MKKQAIISALICILLSVGLHAQNLPNSSGLPSGSTPGVLGYPTNFNQSPNSTPTSFNYTRQYIPLVPLTSISGFTAATAQPVLIATSYLDGFGNGLMGVQYNQSGNDVVTPVSPRKSATVPSYLPYPVSSASKFQNGVFSGQQGFYTGQYPLEGSTGYTKSRAFSISGQPTYARYYPGKALVGQLRGDTMYNTTNVTGDTIYKITLSAGTICHNNARYSSDQLIATVSKSAEGIITRTYTDKSNQTICKKVAFAGAPGGWLATYYVYNSMDKLAAIIPPKASEQLLGATCITNPEKLCYLFTYDDFGNLISKSTPGKTDLELTLYDAAMRAVMAQTPLLKTQNKWAFSVLDQQGRTMYSGLVTSTATEAYWRGVLAGTQTPASYLDASSQPVPPSQTLEYALMHPFTTYPSSLFSCDILSYNYYDDYASAPSPANGVTYSNALSSSFLTGTQMVTPAPYYFTEGKLVAKRSRILDNGYSNNFTNASWITSVFFYDEKGRVIQTQTLNPWNTTTWDISATQYNFSGAVVLDMIRHNSWASSNKTQTTIRTRNNYGYSTGRLESTEQSIDGEAWRTLASYTYDAFGKVTRKWLGSVEEQNYSYNIRNQMTGINSPDPLQETIGTAMSPTESYKESLHYETAFSHPRYDGALTGYRWRTRSSNTYAYGYDYDEAGRMMRAEFREYSPDSSNSYTVQWNHSKRDFSTYNITYDANGNINTLAQKGYNNAMGISVIDNLSYTYDANSNVLRKVTEAGVNTTSVDDFSNGVSNNNNDYTYDADGNLTSDSNKLITAIAYTFQDLPQSVSKNTTNYVHNIYDASGTLIQKQIKEGSTSPIVTYRYWGPFVYVDDKLDYILMPEGRVRYIPDSSSLLKRDYFVKDHLGNVRTVVTADEYTLTHDYLATHEVASANLEESIFSNIAEVRDVRPEAAPGDMRAAGLDGTDSAKRIGTAIVLKVMAGDKISVGAWAWNERKGSEDVYTQPPAMMGTLISTLAGGAGGFSGGEEGNGATIVGNLFSSENYLHAYEGIKTSTTDAANPRSYLNYLVFDREMNLVEEQSGAIQVDGTASAWRYLGLPDELVLHQSGYIAVYISDEDKVKVAWDDVQVIHTKGRLLEESHYYPHGGLYMHQSTDAGMPKDQFTYQGMRLQDELSFNMHDFHARNFDAQIGRFPSIDPMDQFPSGYTGMGNNPANFVDPTGMYISTGAMYAIHAALHWEVTLPEEVIHGEKRQGGTYVGMGDNVNSGKPERVANGRNNGFSRGGGIFSGAFRQFSAKTIAVSLQLLVSVKNGMEQAKNAVADALSRMNDLLQGNTRIEQKGGYMFTSSDASKKNFPGRDPSMIPHADNIDGIYNIDQFMSILNINSAMVQSRMPMELDEIIRFLPNAVQTFNDEQGLPGPQIDLGPSGEEEYGPWHDAIDSSYMDENGTTWHYYGGGKREHK